MQKRLEGKDREIDQLKQEVYHVQQYTRQKDESHTSKEYEWHLMEENKRLKRKVETLQSDMCHLRQSISEQAFTQDELYTCRQVNHELLSKIMTLEVPFCCSKYVHVYS